MLCLKNSQLLTILFDILNNIPNRDENQMILNQLYWILTEVVYSLKFTIFRFLNSIRI